MYVFQIPAVECISRHPGYRNSAPCLDILIRKETRQGARNRVICFCDKDQSMSLRRLLSEALPDLVSSRTQSSSRYTQTSEHNQSHRCQIEETYGSTILYIELPDKSQSKASCVFVDYGSTILSELPDTSQTMHHIFSLKR